MLDDEEALIDLHHDVARSLDEIELTARSLVRHALRRHGLPLALPAIGIPDGPADSTVAAVSGTAAESATVDAAVDSTVDSAGAEMADADRMTGAR